MPIKSFALFLIISSLAGCGSGGGGGGGSFTAIASGSDAADIMDTITSAVDAVDTNLTSGTFTDQTSTGQTGGTATYSGYSTYSTGSCGMSCISSDTYTELTITFSNYEILDGISISSGTVFYTYSYHTQQAGTSFSSTTSISLSSTTPVVASAVAYWSSGVPVGVMDTVEFSGGSSSTLSSLGGTLTTSGGASFSF